jgi:hypothetical protein
MRDWSAPSATEPSTDRNKIHRLGHWWYSSANLFPYLYDFTLSTFIYYFPDPGHYTNNPRYFSNLTTGKVFTM